MKKRYLLLVVFLLLCSVVTACKDKPRGTSEPSGMPSMTVTSSPIVETVTPTVSLPYVTWGLYFDLSISDDLKNEINTILQEKGLNCNIRFVNTAIRVDGDYEDWMATVEQEGGIPDIISVGAWNTPTGGTGFAEQFFFPLDDWINSPDGTRLKDFYSDAEWGKMKVNGSIYTVPRSVKEYFNADVFIAINEKYGDLPEDFDGTYKALKTLYGSIGNSSLKIVFDNPGLDKGTLYALTGCAECMALPYDVQDGCVADFTGSKNRTDNLYLIWNDLCEGTLVFDTVGNMAEAETFALIYRGKRAERDGFKTVKIVSDMYDTNVRLSYGVSRSSKNRELALEVLTACYSDARIASILNWGEENGQLWEERRTLMAEEKPGILTGFLPELSDVQEEELRLYAQSLNLLFQKMYIYNEAQDIYQPSSVFDTVLEDFVKERGKYDEGIEALSKEAKRYIEEANRY